MPGVLAVGDMVAAVGGLLAGYGMRFHTPIKEIGIPVPGVTLQMYLPLLLFGAAMLLVTYIYLDLYDPRLLLRRVFGLSLIMKALTFWLATYLGLSLVLRFEPPISGLFVLVAFGTTFVTTYAWRNLFYLILSRPRWRDRVKQRVALLGNDERTRMFAGEINQRLLHPFQIAGFIRSVGEQISDADSPNLQLGGVEHLDELLRRHEIDVLIVGGLDLPRESFAELVAACERNYTDWKVIPSAFDLFVSNLQLETHGGTPVLGVGPLAIRRLFHRTFKRVLDVFIAVPGFLLSLPLMAAGALLVQRDQRGPVLFRQKRVGANHGEFTMYKLRTMRTGAEQDDAVHQSTAAADPRVLHAGRWLRRWNVDEMPQFWNVICGDMSIVGPRPERPYHVDSLSRRIAHYLPRHLAKPGLTGWAQINGCRGEGDLERRLQHDIYYIENWSPLLDLQIILLTFVRWRAPE